MDLAAGLPTPLEASSPPLEDSTPPQPPSSVPPPPPPASVPATPRPPSCACSWDSSPRLKPERRVAIQPERRVAIQVGRARHVQSSGKNVEFQRTSRATVLVSPRSVVQQSPSPPQKLSPPSQKLSPRREAGSHRLVFQQQRTSPRQLEPLSGGGTSSEDDRLSPPPMLHQRRSSLGKLRAAIEVVELAAPPPVEVEVDASANGGDGGGPSDEPASSSAEPAAALPVASWVADDLAPPRQTRRRSTTTQRQAIRARWRHALELYREVARQARAQELEAAKVVARKEYRHAKARADKLWRENEFDECRTHLDKTLRLKESDVLRRYRSRCQVHRAKAFDAGTEAEGMHGGGQGRRLANRRDDEAAVIHASALRDARHAARLNPKASDNQFMLGRSLERTARSHPGHLGPSAAAYIESMALGQSEAVADAYAAVPEEAAPDDDTFPRGPYRDSPVSRVSNGVEGRFAFVLGAVRRHRDYPALGVHEQYPHLPNAPNVRHGGGGGGAASFGVTAGAARPGQHHALPSFGKQHGSWSMGRKHASIFDPRKRLAESGDTAKIQVGPPGLPPAPRLLLPRGGEEGDEFVHRPDESGDPSKAGRYEATVTWDEPEDDGGDEIYQYSLQLSRYDVKWEPALGDLFDGFRPWETVHEGPAKVMSHRLAELLPNNTYKVRVSCLNSVGSSEWSEPYLSFDSPSVETEGGGQVASRPAKSWLRVPMPEVLLEHTKLVLEGSTADDFMVELAEALQGPDCLPPGSQPNVQLLKAIFKMYAAGTASNLSGGTEINGTQFGRFARDVGLSTGLNPLSGERNGLAALPSVQVDLVYQKAIADEIHSRNAAWRHVQGAQADAAEGVRRESLATEAARPDKETSERAAASLSARSCGWRGCSCPSWAAWASA